MTLIASSPKTSPGESNEPTATPLATELVTSGFVRPVFATSPPGDFERLFVVEQRVASGVAQIKILDLKTRTIKPKPFLQINNVSNGNEQGLLSLAFHPDYDSNGYFYINYTNNVGVGNTVLSRWQVSTANPDSADPASETLILGFNQPFSNHNGGWIAFGPNDGYLYIATGDGGSGGDPQNNAQNRNSLLGKILRIDVDAAFPYAIPPTNPYFGGPLRQEIWHYGLRNPWRCSFDRQDFDLYIADVGQNNWEEIDFHPAADTGGYNFGWRLKEGKHCYDPPTMCDTLIGLTDPITEYNHNFGCSVTGGYVYRGCAVPDLRGTYFFADYCDGTIWSFRYDGVNLTDSLDRTVELGLGGFGLTSFAEDNMGEIYVIYQSGQIYKIVPATAFNDCNNNNFPDSCDIAFGISKDLNANAIPDECEPGCGDVNASGMINIADAVYLLGFIFSGGPPPNPINLGDVNCNGIVNIADVVYLIAYIFSGGPPPCAAC